MPHDDTNCAQFCGILLHFLAVCSLDSVLLSHCHKKMRVVEITRAGNYNTLHPIFSSACTPRTGNVYGKVLEISGNL